MPMNDPYPAPSASGNQRPAAETITPHKLPKEELVNKIKSDLSRMRNHTGQWRRDAKEDFAFYAGDQWSDDDIAQLKEALRPVITYNRVQPMIDAIAGLEVNNRQETRFVPRQVGDVGINEVLTGAVDWARDNCDAEDEESDAFLDNLICGMGWTETRIVYDEDPDGKICIDRVDPMEMYWDTAAKKRNLVDARHIARIKDYDQIEFLETWPEMAGKVSPRGGGGDEGWADDEGEGHFNDEIGYVGGEQDQQFDAEKKVYRVIEYQWYELETYYRTVNPETGEIEEVSAQAMAKLRDVLEAAGLPSVKQKRRHYYKAFLTDNQIIEVIDNAVQTGFTYQCMTGKRDRNKRTWYGVVRNLKDPARWANKFFSQILHVLNTNAKGGIMAEKSAFLDPNKAETTWAASDNIALMQDGALSGGSPKVMPKPGAPYPQGTDRLMQMSLGAFQEVTGVNMELLGQADAQNRSGILEYQRKESAVTILAPMFDALRRYRKNQGRIMLEFIQLYMSDGRLVRIVAGDGTEQYVELVRNEEAITYDVIVDEAPSSPNQKDKVFSVLTQLLPALLQAGIPIPPDVLDYAPLPTGLVSKWKEMMQPKEPGQEKPSPEEMKAQAAAQKDASVVQLNQAKAQKEAAAVQTEAAKAQAVQAQAQAQMARIAELTPVDAAQAEKFAAAARLDQERAETERVRQNQMVADGLAGRDLLEEKMDTEEARQQALRSRPDGTQDR